MYSFFPETNQLQLEDIDHLFENGAGDITGGVFGSKGGRTVEAGYHARVEGARADEKAGEERGEVV